MTRYTEESLQKFVGCLFIHTPKAVKANSAIVITPQDRVFAVVKVLPAKPAVRMKSHKPPYKTFVMESAEPAYLIAWKCTLLPGGWLEHPKYPGKKFRPNDSRLFSDKGRSQSEPTAFFRPDSFYRQVSADELMNL